MQNVYHSTNSISTSEMFRFNYHDDFHHCSLFCNDNSISMLFQRIFICIMYKRNYYLLSDFFLFALCVLPLYADVRIVAAAGSIKNIHKSLENCDVAIGWNQRIICNAEQCQQKPHILKSRFCTFN